MSKNKKQNNKSQQIVSPQNSDQQNLRKSLQIDDDQNHQLKKDQLDKEFEYIFSKNRQESQKIIEKRHKGTSKQKIETYQDLIQALDCKQQLSQDLNDDDQFTDDEEDEEFQQQMNAVTIKNFLINPSNHLIDLNFQQYDELIRTKGVLDELAYEFNEKLKNQVDIANSKSSGTKQRQILEKCLRMIDKKTFTQLRDGQLTISQVLAKISQIYYNFSYKTFDDIKDKLLPKISNAKISQEILRKMYNKNETENVELDDIINPKDAWLSNKHCRRSLLFDPNQKNEKSVIIKPISDKIDPEVYKKQFEQTQRLKEQQEIQEQYMRNVQEAKMIFSDEQLHEITRMTKQISQNITRNLSIEQKALLVSTEIGKDIREDILSIIQHQVKRVINHEKQLSLKNKTQDISKTNSARRIIHESLSEHFQNQRDLLINYQILNQLKYLLKTHHYPSSKNENNLSTLNISESLSQIRNREQDQFYRTHQFIKRMEDYFIQEDGSESQRKIIWGDGKREKFILIEKEFQNKEKQIQGQKKNKNQENEIEKEIKKQKKKPRPVEIMNEQKFIGKFGTEIFKKKMNLNQPLKVIYKRQKNEKQSSRSIEKDYEANSISESYKHQEVSVKHAQQSNKRLSDLADSLKKSSKDDHYFQLRKDKLIIVEDQKVEDSQLQKIVSQSISLDNLNAQKIQIMKQNQLSQDMLLVKADFKSQSRSGSYNISSAQQNFSQINLTSKIEKNNQTQEKLEQNNETRELVSDQNILINKEQTFDQMAAQTLDQRNIQNTKLSFSQKNDQAQLQSEKNLPPKSQIQKSQEILSGDKIIQDNKRKAIRKFIPLRNENKLSEKVHHDSQTQMDGIKTVISDQKIVKGLGSLNYSSLQSQNYSQLQNKLPQKQEDQIHMNEYQMPVNPFQTSNLTPEQISILQNIQLQDQFIQNQQFNEQNYLLEQIFQQNYLNKKDVQLNFEYLDNQMNNTQTLNQQITNQTLHDQQNELINNQTFYEKCNFKIDDIVELNRNQSQIKLDKIVNPVLQKSKNQKATDNPCFSNLTSCHQSQVNSKTVSVVNPDINANPQFDQNQAFFEKQIIEAEINKFLLVQRLNQDLTNKLQFQNFDFSQNIEKIQNVNQTHRNDYKLQMTQQLFKSNQKNSTINTLKRAQIQQLERTVDDSQNLLDLFKINIDVNNLEEESLKYLYSQQSGRSIFKRDIPFLKKTLMNLGSFGGKGQLVTIQSARPEQLPSYQKLMKQKNFQNVLASRFANKNFISIKGINQEPVFLKTKSIKDNTSITGQTARQLSFRLLKDTSSKLLNKIPSVAVIDGNNQVNAKHISSDDEKLTQLNQNQTQINDEKKNEEQHQEEEQKIDVQIPLKLIRRGLNSANPSKRLSLAKRYGDEKKSQKQQFSKKSQSSKSIQSKTVNSKNESIKSKTLIDQSLYKHIKKQQEYQSRQTIAGNPIQSPIQNTKSMSVNSLHLSGNRYTASQQMMNIDVLNQIQDLQENFEDLTCTRSQYQKHLMSKQNSQNTQAVNTKFISQQKTPRYQEDLVILKEAQPIKCKIINFDSQNTNQQQKLQKKTFIHKKEDQNYLRKSNKHDLEFTKKNFNQEIKISEQFQANEDKFNYQMKSTLYKQFPKRNFVSGLQRSFHLKRQGQENSKFNQQGSINPNQFKRQANRNLVSARVGIKNELLTFENLERQIKDQNDGSTTNEIFQQTENLNEFNTVRQINSKEEILNSNYQMTQRIQSANIYNRNVSTQRDNYTYNQMNNINKLINSSKNSSSNKSIFKNQKLEEKMEESQEYTLKKLGNYNMNFENSLEKRTQSNSLLQNSAMNKQELKKEGRMQNEILIKNSNIYQSVQIQNDIKIYSLKQQATHDILQNSLKSKTFSLNQNFIQREQIGLQVNLKKQNQYVPKTKFQIIKTSKMYKSLKTNASSKDTFSKNFQKTDINKESYMKSSDQFLGIENSLMMKNSDQNKREYEMKNQSINQDILQEYCNLNELIIQNQQTQINNHNAAIHSASMAVNWQASSEQMKPLLQSHFGKNLAIKQLHQYTGILQSNVQEKQQHKKIDFTCIPNYDQVSRQKKRIDLDSIVDQQINLLKNQVESPQQLQLIKNGHATDGSIVSSFEQINIMKGNYLSSSRFDEIERRKQLIILSQSPLSIDSLEQSKEQIMENQESNLKIIDNNFIAELFNPNIHSRQNQQLLSGQGFCKPQLIDYSNENPNIVSTSMNQEFNRYDSNLHLSNLENSNKNHMKFLTGQTASAKNIKSRDD